jgi:hydrogenase maturation factor
MTASTTSMKTWAVKPFGKATRVALASLGMIFATMVLTSAAVVETGSWALVLVGVAIAATSVRAARELTMARLAGLGAALLAIPITLQIF